MKNSNVTEREARENKWWQTYKLREAVYESRLLSELRYAEANLEEDDDFSADDYHAIRDLCKYLLKKAYGEDISFTVNYLKNFLVNFASETEKKLSEMELSEEAGSNATEEEANDQ